MRCYRIVQPRHAARALSGEGARLYGGRWSPPGRPCVYAADSRALATLEMLVHLPGHTRSLPYRLLTIEVPDESVTRAPHLPTAWNAMPPGRASQTVGAEWLAARKTAALMVPSVIIPEESNLLLNPQAPGFDAIRVLEERDLRFDLRLPDA
jgi:RES domain-containing protein